MKARRKEKAAKAESRATIEAAKVIARDIDLKVDWDSSCDTCIIGLSKIIVDCGHNKGLIFHQLHQIPEGIFRNCERELQGFADYKGKMYYVSEQTGYVDLVQ